MAKQRAHSVAIIGGGASGAVTASVLKEEGVFDTIRVFERRSEVGGVWCYDASSPHPFVPAGATEATTDPPLPIPHPLPARTPPSAQERWVPTPNYATLTTNVPAVGMTYSDRDFAVPDWREQPFMHHSIVRRYIEDYFSSHGVGGDDILVRNTSVEQATKDGDGKWRLVLRRREGAQDAWWEERFDAVVVAVGHYHVPYIPPVPGLAEFQERFPGVVEHSKFYRSPEPYAGKKVLIIGNRASGSDILRDILPLAQQPVYQSRRSTYAFSPASPPAGAAYKPVIARFDAATGAVHFADGTVDGGFDRIVYTTGYRYSYPFLAAQASTGNRIAGTYQHTFCAADPSLAFVGSVVDAISFRAFEFQAIAVSRFWRGLFDLPAAADMRRWEQQRLADTGDTRLFHTIGWSAARTWWEEMVALAAGPEGAGGRAFPHAGEAFWKELEGWKLKVVSGWKERNPPAGGDALGDRVEKVGEEAGKKEAGGEIEGEEKEEWEEGEGEGDVEKAEYTLAGGSKTGSSKDRSKIYDGSELPPSTAEGWLGQARSWAQRTPLLKVRSKASQS